MKRPRKRGSSVAVIDIGSNSVRLVVYEGLARSLIPIFNEKTLCGLGREVQSTGLLAPDAVEKALTSLKRFRALCRVMQVGRVFAIATAACRDASNGPDFIAKAERICAVKIEILSGPREARLSALGVIFRHPSPRRHRRRSRRRFARTDRRAQEQRAQRRDAAARRPRAAGSRA
ncbi:exopolyphosphatase/pppGpp-phosphohydrolase [Bradyrhizobium sp. LM6.9]